MPMRAFEKSSSPEQSSVAPFPAGGMKRARGANPGFLGTYIVDGLALPSRVLAEDHRARIERGLEALSGALQVVAEAVDPQRAAHARDTAGGLARIA